MKREVELKEFFEKYGFNIQTLTLKEQRIILKNIVDNAKLEQDLMEIRYHKNPENYLVDEYNSQMENLFINQLYAHEQMLRVRYLERQDRKLKLKQFFQGKSLSKNKR